MASKKIKAAGTRFENRVKKYLESLGWKVFRSAGSRSCADLVAFRSNHTPLWVQCKASDIPTISKDERYDLYMGQQFMNIKALIVGRLNQNHKLIFYILNDDGLAISYSEEIPSWIL